MEIILLIVVGVVIYFVVKVGIVIYLVVTAKSSSTITLPQIMPFEIRLQDVQVETEYANILVKEIQARGVFPLMETKNTAAWISILAENTGQPLPVISIISHDQENDSPVFFIESKLGIVGPDHEISDWVRIGGAFSEFMHPPYGGQQTLTVVVRLVDLSEQPRIHFGHMLDETALLWEGRIKFTHYFEKKGYMEEAAEHQEEAQILTLKIAMAVAMSDGNLDTREGELMNEWIKGSISSSSEEEYARLKEIFNQTLHESYAEAKEGSLNLQSLANRLNDIAETSNKYQAYELASNIMAADLKADPNEIEALNELAEWLDLDSQRVTEMMDACIVQLDMDISTSVENLLGIKPDWSDARIKKHLTSEFNKWNNRLNTLPEGKERDNVQHLLERIAVARKKNQDKNKDDE